MSVTFSRSLLAAVTLLSGAVAPLVAQREGPQPPIGGGVRFTVAQPIGEFKNYVDNGWGIGGEFRWFPGEQRVASLRVDGNFLNYGRQTTRECFGSGCRIQIDINTSNNIFSGLVGPELQAPSGPIRPYVNAMGGWTVFWTQSSAEGADENDSLFRTTNLRDNLFSAAVGGGIRIPFAEQVKLDLNVRRNFNGRARYLTRDSFGDGTRTTPIIRNSEANMWTYGVGLSFGF